MPLVLKILYGSITISLFVHHLILSAGFEDAIWVNNLSMLFFINQVYVMVLKMLYGLITATF